MPEPHENGATKFSAMVRALEGLLDAGEFTDAKLRSEWYDRWGPLEVRSAVAGDDVGADDALEEVRSMKDFLAKHLGGSS